MPCDSSPIRFRVRSLSRFVFLVNAAAGTGLAPRRLDALLARHPDLAARSRLVRSSSAAELDALLRLDDDEIPTAVGGDGSFNALATLMDRRGELQRTLALVPFGTGNATAHTLGLRTAALAFAAIEQGETTALDIMRTSIPAAPIALVSCSTGFESNFLLQYSSLRYRSRKYAGLSALLLNVPKRVRGVTLTIDGAEWVHPTELVHNVGVYNIPHYAFGKVMWRGVEKDDGLAIAALQPVGVLDVRHHRPWCPSFEGHPRQATGGPSEGVQEFVLEHDGHLTGDHGRQRGLREAKRT